MQECTLVAGDGPRNTLTESGEESLHKSPLIPISEQSGIHVHVFFHVHIHVHVLSVSISMELYMDMDTDSKKEMYKDMKAYREKKPRTLCEIILIALYCTDIITLGM